MNYLKNIKHIALSLVLPMAFASCTDVWNEHYDVNNEKLSADKTLWEEIDSRPELQEFAACLKQHGYDKVLDGDQIYTVFAPQGALDIDKLPAEKIKEEVLENHIARSAHSANKATVNKSVMMLNEKLVDFTIAGESYTLGNVALTGTNIIAKNGVLHILTGKLPFFFNIWEYMTTDSAYSKVCEYMYSFDEYELDEEASVKGPIVDGLQTYVDSVLDTYNKLRVMLGDLNDEDSTYTMILPTNKAWDEAYQRIAPYYVYNSKNEHRDSLQDYYTKLGIVSDLIFSHTVQKSMTDSLISTSLNVFKNPFEYILDGYSSMDDGVVCSNGNVFVVDELKHHPWDSWHTRLKVEAERINGHKVAENTSIEYSRNMENTNPLHNKVSKSAYLEVVSKKLYQANAPSVDFYIWNTLAATYDIKVVFLPQSLATDKIYGIAPVHLAADLSYVNDKDKTQKEKLIEAKDSVFVDPTRIDTVNLGTFTFPVTTYGEEKASTTLTVKSASNSKDKVNSRVLLIDCVILEPTKE